MIPCGTGSMSSRTACKTGFWWRYANTADQAIANNKHVIQIFPFICKDSNKYPWSSDLRSSSVTLTLTYSSNDVRTYSKTLYTKYNWGNVPTATLTDLTSVGNKLCGLVESQSNLPGEQSSYHNYYKGFSCYGASNKSEYCTYTRSSDKYPYLDPQLNPQTESQIIYGAQFDVPANSDGSMPTVKVKWNMVIYSGHGTISYETNITLDTIPRASTITQNRSSFSIIQSSSTIDAEKNRITITKANATFAHKLVFKLANTNVTISENVSNNTSSLTETYDFIPKNYNSILDNMNSPSTLTRTVNMICYTYPNATIRNADTNNDGTGSIGNKSLSFTIKIESNDYTKPVINTPSTPNVANPFTVSGTKYALIGRSYLTGIKATYNSLKYGATYSKTNMTLTVGSTVSQSWEVTDNGSNPKESNIISSVSDMVIKATITDSRGFVSTEKSYTFPSSRIKNYSLPSLQTANLYRSDSAGGVYFSFSAKFSKIDISGDKNVNKVLTVNDGTNTWVVTYNGSTTTTTYNGSSSSGGSYDSTNNILSITKNNLTGYAITSTFTFTITIYDAVIGSSGATPIIRSIGTVEDLMNFNSSGKSMAIGGISTRGSSEKVLDNNLKFYSIAGGQFRGAQGSSWVKDRDVALVWNNNTTQGGAYYPVISQKTKDGNWTIGQLSGENNLTFNYTTDTNYNNNNNTSSRWNINTSGKWSGSCASADTATNIANKAFATRSSVGDAGWTSSTGQQDVVCRSLIAFWNGAYSGTTSNLQYCDRGRFGTIITKGTGDYEPKTTTGTQSKTSTATPSGAIACTVAWRYIKFDNGIAMCWGRTEVSTTINTTWGNLKTSVNITLPNYPDNLFNDIPSLTYSSTTGDSWSAFICAASNNMPSKTSPGNVFLCRGNNSASTQKYIINIQAIGTWK